MVSTLRELRAVKHLLKRATAEVDERGQTRAPHFPFGVMVEVPSAAVVAPGIARAARNATRPVSVWGTVASDPLAGVLLVGMGLWELSMEASRSAMRRAPCAGCHWTRRPSTER